MRIGHAHQAALRQRRLTALGITEPQLPDQHRPAQIELLTVSEQLDSGEVKPVAVLNPEGECKPVREVDDRLVLHLAARHLAGQPVVAASYIRPRIVNLVRLRLGRRTATGEAPVPQRAQCLAQALPGGVKALVNKRPRAQDRPADGARVAHHTLSSPQRRAVQATAPLVAPADQSILPYPAPRGGVGGPLSWSLPGGW